MLLTLRERTHLFLPKVGSFPKPDQAVLVPIPCPIFYVPKSNQTTTFPHILKLKASDQVAISVFVFVSLMLLNSECFDLI